MIERTLNLSKELGKFSSALLFGARGVGKSYWCKVFLAEVQRQNAGESVLEYDLLKYDIFERLLKKPHLIRLEIEERLKTKGRLIVFIDEIQKIPFLLDEVHGLIESHPKKLRFLLSGSSARKLKRTGANLLAGRALTLRMHPLTENELPGSEIDRCRLGSLPGIIVENEATEQSLRSYVSTYLKEEIQQEALVRRFDAFARFLEVAAQYHCEIINASSIADAAGVSSQTISDYFQILEDTLVGWRLPGWSASAKKQLRTTPKFYFFDNGVANALRGELAIELKESSSRFGKLFEAWIIQEAIRHNDYKQLDLKFSYWRTNNDIEVDLVVSRGAARPIAAIEIKSSIAPKAREVTGLSRFAQDYPKAQKICVCRAENAYEDFGVKFLPWRQLYGFLETL